MRPKNTPFSTLCMVYAIAIAVGMCEYAARQKKTPQETDIFADPVRNFPKSVARLYPDSAEAEYAAGRHYEAIAGSGFDPEQVKRNPEVRRRFLASLSERLNEAAKHYERAISMGLKSDESLYYNYALTLIRIQKPSSQIDQAIANWRKNFPFSDRKDLAVRRKSIEEQLRSLGPTGSTTTNLAPLNGDRPADARPFDSTKQNSAAIEASLGTVSEIQWQSNPGYIGSENCRECHASEFESYKATAHSRALSNANIDNEPKDTVFDHAPSGRRFRVERHEGKLYHRESLLLDDGTEFPLTSMPVTYRVGSGNFARTYLAQVRAGFFVESPITWYESTHSWGMTPGFDKPSHKSFTRAILENCLQCHCGQVETSKTNQMQLHVVEDSIGCERCHGPGESHAAAHRAKRIPTGDQIVNPKRLSRHASESICQQCHLQGDIQIGGKNHNATEYRPGRNLEDFSTVFRVDNINSGMTVVGHVEQLGASACYRESDTLTCATCHNPHKTLKVEERTAHYRDVCLSCHNDQDCRAEKSIRLNQTMNDCVQCHMPKSKTEVPHVAFTHHRIGIDLRRQSHQPNVKTTDEIDNSVIPLSDLSVLNDLDRERSLMLAKLQAFLLRGPTFAQTTTGSRWKSQIKAWLHQLSDQDAEMQFAVSQFLLACGELSEFRLHAISMLRHPKIRTEEAAAINQQLAELEIRRGQSLAAEPYYQTLVQLRVHGMDWFELGRIRFSSSDFQAADRAFQIARNLMPADRNVYELLLKTHLAQSDLSKVEQIRNELDKLNHQKVSRQFHDER